MRAHLHESTRPRRQGRPYIGRGGSPLGQLLVLRVVSHLRLVLGELFHGRRNLLNRLRALFDLFQASAALLQGLQEGGESIDHVRNVLVLELYPQFI